MPAPNPKAQECAQGFMARVARVNNHPCPVCQQGRMGVVQTLAGVKRLPNMFEDGAKKPTAGHHLGWSHERDRHRRQCEHLKPLTQLRRQLRQGRA